MLWHTSTTSASPGPALPCAGWRCWGSDSGNAGLGSRPYSARILHPPSLHLPSAPVPRPRRPQQPQLPQQGGMIFLRIHRWQRTATTTTHVPRIFRPATTPATSTTSTHPPIHNQHSPRTQSQSSRVFNGRPWSGPAELFYIGHPKSSGSGRAGSTLRISGLLARQSASQPSEKPRAVPRPAAGTERVSRRLVLVLGIFPLTARAIDLVELGVCLSRANRRLPEAKWVVRRPAGTATPAGSDE